MLIELTWWPCQRGEIVHCRQLLCTVHCCEPNSPQGYILSVKKHHMSDGPPCSAHWVEFLFLWRIISIGRYNCMKVTMPLQKRCQSIVSMLASCEKVRVKKKKVPILLVRTVRKTYITWNSPGDFFQSIFFIFHFLDWLVRDRWNVKRY